MGEEKEEAVKEEDGEEKREEQLVEELEDGGKEEQESDADNGEDGKRSNSITLGEMHGGFFGGAFGVSYGSALPLATQAFSRRHQLSDFEQWRQWALSDRERRATAVLEATSEG